MKRLWTQYVAVVNSWPVGYQIGAVALLVVVEIVVLML